MTTRDDETSLMSDVPMTELTRDEFALYLNTIDDVRLRMHMHIESLLDDYNQ